MTMICHSHGSVVNQKGGKADRGGPPPKKGAHICGCISWWGLSRMGNLRNEDSREKCGELGWLELDDGDTKRTREESKLRERGNWWDELERAVTDEGESDGRNKKGCMKRAQLPSWRTHSLQSLPLQRTENPEYQVKTLHRFIFRAVNISSQICFIVTSLQSLCFHNLPFFCLPSPDKACKVNF